MTHTYYKMRPQRKNRRGAYFKCETCGKEFYAYPSYIKKSAERGATIRYCSMACYDKTGDNNPFWGKRHRKESIKKMVEHPNHPVFAKGINNPNFTRYGEKYGFQGSHYLWWRRKLVKEIGKCEQCEFNNKNILTLHHKDRDRKNNERENLELLCWNCHMLEHYSKKDGPYKFIKEIPYD